MLDLNKKFNNTNGIYDEYNRMPYHDSNNHMNLYDNPPKDLYRAPYDPMNMSDGVIRGTSRADYSPLKKSLAITALLSIAVVLIAKLFAGNVVPIGFGLLFFIIGSIVFWTTIFNCSSKKKICTQPVTAVCHDLHVSVSRDSDGTTSRTYSPVWRYYFNGNYYEHHESHSSNIDVPRVGEERTLMIDPSDPLTIYRKSISQMLFLLIFGLIFMIVPMLIVMID